MTIKGRRVDSILEDLLLLEKTKRNVREITFRDNFTIRVVIDRSDVIENYFNVIRQKTFATQTQIVRSHDIGELELWIEFQFLSNNELDVKYSFGFKNHRDGLRLKDLTSEDEFEERFPELSRFVPRFVFSDPAGKLFDLNEENEERTLDFVNRHEIIIESRIRKFLRSEMLKIEEFFNHIFMY